MTNLPDMVQMHGRISVITGGAGHLGRAMARTLLAAGGRVVLADRDTDSLKAAMESLGEPDQIATVTCDLEQEDQLRSLPEKAAACFDGFDVLVNNAAFVGVSKLEGWVGPLDSQSNETWRRAMDVNLTAPFSLIRDSVPILAAGTNPAIINVGSLYGAVAHDPRIYNDTAMGLPLAYGAGKAGLHHLTRLMATELAPSGIRVNAISPGGIERGQPDIFVERYNARTPMGRMATEDDMTGTILYLASQMSAYVTGQVVQVDGGLTIW